MRLFQGYRQDVRAVAFSPDGRYLAADHGFVSVMNSLLSTKADINAEDDFGNTPLTGAVQNGFRPAAELLLSHGLMLSFAVRRVLS